MITKLLDAEAIINNHTIQIVNTEMNISVEYDVKNDISVKSIFGEFSFNTKKINYQKKTTIKFTTDNTWSTIINCSLVLKEQLPEFASINFDTKTIKIQFY